MANYVVRRYRALPISTGIITAKQTIDFQLFPNPALVNSYIQLSLNSDDLDDLQYTVSNATGISILTGIIENERTRISTQSLPSGWYTLSVNGDDAFGSRIFFVQ